MIRILLLALASFFYLSAAEFVIVIPSYNNKDRYEENLDSVIFQTNQNFRVIYIDDASPDGTGDLVKEYIRKHRLEDRVRLIRNTKRAGTLANVYQAVWLCNPHEIVVDLDGDDRLAHNDVLTNLSAVYADPNVWLTYGDWIYSPSDVIGEAQQVPLSVIDQNEFRSFHRGGTTPLRTFYAGLFHRIKREDLLFEGNFFQVASDLAFMFPMLEMAGRHIKFISNIDYVYNNETPLNDHNLRYQQQRKADEYLRGKEKYQPVDHYCQIASRKKIYIFPGQWGELFSIDNPIYNRDGCLEVTYKLREFAAAFGFDLEQVNSLESLDDFEYLISFDIPMGQLHHLNQYPQEKLILFLWEPPSIIPENYNPAYHRYFSKVYTWDDSLIDNEKYFKFYYPRLLPMITDRVDFEKKLLSAMICFNKTSAHPQELFSKRQTMIDFFERLPFGDFNLYGKGWPQTLQNYQGPIGRKVDYMKYYKFNFCYENVRAMGYVSEKIFDCFQAGGVPVYLGAPNVADYIPKNCFIHSEDFPNEQSLYDYLKSMPKTQYEGYVNNIERFLESDQALLYSPENFNRIFMNLVMELP